MGGGQILVLIIGGNSKIGSQVRRNPGIVRIARDSKLRVQNQVILRGSVLPEELGNRE